MLSYAIGGLSARHILINDYASYASYSPYYADEYPEQESPSSDTPSPESVSHQRPRPSFHSLSFYDMSTSFYSDSKTGEVNGVQDDAAVQTLTSKQNGEKALFEGEDVDGYNKIKDEFSKTVEEAIDVYSSIGEEMVTGNIKTNYDNAVNMYNSMASTFYNSREYERTERSLDPLFELSESSKTPSNDSKEQALKDTAKAYMKSIKLQSDVDDSEYEKIEDKYETELETGAQYGLDYVRKEAKDLGVNLVC